MTCNLSDIKKLKSEYKYHEARKILLGQASDDSECLRNLAECYYKDLELHQDFSYPKALEILDKIIDVTSPEKTLQLKGAIYKRKWEYQGNLDDLYKSIENYEQAYMNYKEKDEGYGAINAAYMYDVLANKISSFDKEYSTQLNQKATNIRKDIINTFGTKKDNLWIYHTLAQAYFGTGDLNAAKSILEESKNLDCADWEKFTTYKQLKLLAKLKNIDDLHCLLPLIGEENRHI